MKSKLMIPSLLLGVVMIAGAFAFMPVQEASTVHTTIQGTQAQVQTATDPSVTTASADSDTFSITIDTSNGDPFVVQQILVCSVTTGSGTNSATTVTIDGDSILDIAGAALSTTPILTTADKTGCLELVTALNTANPEVPLVLASNGGSIVIAGTIAKQNDGFTSVKVVALVDGSSTLTVVSADTT